MIIILLLNFVSILNDSDECKNQTIKDSISCEGSAAYGLTIKAKGYCCKGRKTSNGNHCCYMNSFSARCTEITKKEYKKIPTIFAQIDEAYEAGNIHVKTDIDCNSNIIKNYYILILILFIIF